MKDGISGKRTFSTLTAACLLVVSVTGSLHGAEAFNLQAAIYPAIAYLGIHAQACIDVAAGNDTPTPLSMKLTSPPFPLAGEPFPYRDSAGKIHFCSCMNVPDHAAPGDYKASLEARFRNKRRLVVPVEFHLRRPKPAGEETILSSRNQNILSQFYTTPVTMGNRIEVLDDGPGAFEKLKETIASARHSIFLQTFLFETKGRSGEIYEILKEKARSGVEVKVILTRYSQMGKSPSTFIDMKMNGIDVIMIGDISLPREKVVEYSPWHKLMQDQYILLKKIPDKAPFAKWIKSDSGKSQVIEYSLHEKMLIIDGERAIAGGRNIADNYYFWWKDTDLYMEGPIVDAVNKEFLANWTEFGGQPPKTTQAMNLHTDKGLPASLADSKPWKGNFSTQEMLCKAIGMSEKSVYITTQFIALPDSLGQALKAAASRGIDVRILTNSYETGQEVAYSLCHYISLNHYRELMAAGVRIYEYQSPPGAKQKPYYHTKQFIIDGLWTSIGSFNLSVRSAYIESELQINIPDGAFSGTRQDVFLKTLSESSSEVSFENYAREEDRFGPLMGAAKLVELLY